MAFPQRRYQVFISSTFGDLAQQRKQAVEVVFQTGHIPIALENFAPSNRSDLEVITEVIRDCQVYLMILGHRYGTLVPGEDISFTELEYNLAEKHGLLILTFLLRQNEIDARRNALDQNNERDRLEQGNIQRLDRFHGRLTRFRRFWGEEDDFKYLVLQSLNQEVAHCEKRGFIREPSPEATALITSAASNPFIVDIASQLESFEQLHRRCSEQVAEKEAIARFLREQYLDRLVAKRTRLFFESGSTVAFLAKDWAPTLSREMQFEADGSPTIQISTNNVLAYLEFWLNFRIPCATFPWGPPSREAYGASYGSLERIEDRQPDYTLEPLDTTADREIEKLLNANYPFTFRAPVLLLGAVSGLQLGTEHVVKFPDDVGESCRHVVGAQIAQCFGPHVGSYRNKLFKRFMYATEMPLIITITGDKIDCPIDPSQTHFIFDAGLTWSDFLRTHPLAVCVGCRQGDHQRLVEAFASAGFSIRDGSYGVSTTAFLARNSAFIEQFESFLDD